MSLSNSRLFLAFAVVVVLSVRAQETPVRVTCPVRANANNRAVTFMTPCACCRVLGPQDNPAFSCETDINECDLIQPCMANICPFNITNPLPTVPPTPTTPAPATS